MARIVNETSAPVNLVIERVVILAPGDEVVLGPTETARIK